MPRNRIVDFGVSPLRSQVRRLDARVDRVSLVPLTRGPELEAELQAAGGVAASALTSPRVNELLGIVKALSSGSVSGAHLSPSRIKRLLRQSGLTGDLQSVELLEGKSQYEADVEWLLVGKATVQTYGLLMTTLLDQIIPLSDDIWYWDEILGSYPNSFLYTVQTSPLRMLKWTREVYSDSVDRFQRLYRDEIVGQAAEDDGVSAQQDARAASHKPKGFKSLYPELSKHWRQFYGIVRQSVARRSIADMQRKILSRVDIGRSEARYKQKRLRRLREMTATGLGVLLDEGLNFGITDETPTDEWKGMLERSVALMDMILQAVLFLDLSVSEFEDKVFTGVEEDPELSIHIEESHPAVRPAVLARRLLGLLDKGLPTHRVAITGLAQEHGRPSRLVRYWLPAAALLVSSSTILRILINRQDDIIAWIRDFGATARDFWFNWVVDPVRKIVGTIRHDATSEIAIMSRDSLKADRDSLERMVVEFAIDNPEIAVGSASISEHQIGEIRSKVKEGDVTPVLRAYEKDLRRPVVGAIRGELVRSLLIQVQKTKVDLEVAISGIDALLKSQELVFGFVGLTPGVLGMLHSFVVGVFFRFPADNPIVSIGVFQYLRTMFGSRKGLRRGRRARRSVRVLRKIDRILSEATTSQNNIISYRDHGLLVCEVHVLRGLAHGVLPGDVEKEFIEDLDELANLKGIQVQTKALERIRWAYAEWLGRMR